jgi:hypothetical protein
MRARHLILQTVPTRRTFADGERLSGEWRPDYRRSLIQIVAVEGNAGRVATLVMRMAAEMD